VQKSTRYPASSLDRKRPKFKLNFTPLVLNGKGGHEDTLSTKNELIKMVNADRVNKQVTWILRMMLLPAFVRSKDTLQSFGQAAMPDVKTGADKTSSFGQRSWLWGHFNITERKDQQ
jgi:hypothetical protein